MKVVIVGGTHGNEKSGVFLLQKWIENPQLLPSGHDYKFCFGNPQAMAKNQRFIDFDLNRSFNSGNKNHQSYEYQRVQELQAEIENWSQGQKYFLIDLHTTTTHMGTTLVLSKNDLLTAHVLATLQEQHKNYRLLFNKDRDSDCHFVDSMAPHGFIVEIGPVAQNVYDAQAIFKTEQVVYQTLRALHQVENKILNPIELVGYEEAYEVLFPRDKNGNVQAIIHPHFKAKDYQPLFKGMPVFQTLSGDEIAWQGEDNTYPLFVNEAAYLKDHIAFIVSFLSVRSYSLSLSVNDEIV